MMDDQVLMSACLSDSSINMDCTECVGNIMMKVVNGRTQLGRAYMRDSVIAEGLPT